MEEQDRINNKKTFGRTKMITIAIIPLLVLAGMVVFLFAPGQSLLNLGIPLPEITIERIEFQEGKIIIFVRNTGPEKVEVAQADINDRITAAAIEPDKILSRLEEAKVIVPFLWTPGVPYEVGVTTSDGTRFSKGIDAAALAPTPNVEQASYFAMIGIYVGVIPVMIGLLWLPFMKRLSVNKYKFFLSITVGLLAFLGIDAIVESNEIAAANVAGAFNSQVLIAMVTIVSFLILLYSSEKLVERAAIKYALLKTSSSSSSRLPSHSYSSRSSSLSSSSSSSYATTMQQKQQLLKPIAIALTISIGIGLHNLGEGLAIGAAILLGEVALSTFLIVGFTLHNTTEGLAIVAPLAKRGSSINIRRLIGMALIAGVPTILGTWIGGFLYSPIFALIFLSIGAGAIFQVIFSILSWIAQTEGSRRTALSSTPMITGFIVGMSIMYMTSLLISS